MESLNQYPKILIVDDVAANLDLMKIILQAKNYLTTYVNNIESAIEQTTKNTFDIILFNTLNSVQTAFNICHKINEGNVNKGTPIIFLAEKPIEKNQVNGFNLGLIDYIRKPFSEEELFARIDLHLSLRKIKNELEKAKCEAEDAAKAKALFLANMSHEIRTPLNGIVGMVDVLNQTVLNKQQKDYLEIIGISTETLLMIINDVLDFSKIDAGQIDFEHVKFSLKKEIFDVHKLLSYKANQKNLDFTIKFSADVPEIVKGDPLRLKQILINLTTNAVKFTENGFVHIEVSLVKQDKDSHTLKFEVSDSGIGVSKEKADKLFESFSQADPSTTRKYGGTGLGLAISKRLSKMMNGDIGVISKEGEGSTFWFTAILERIESYIDENIMSNVNDVVQPNRKLNILLAEDNEINQKVSMLNIQKLGHKLKLAPDGKVAVDMFMKDKFDLILMDIHMPGMDGVEATMEIRRIESEKEISDPIPIIAMTANIYKDDITGFLSAGMTDHLGKPFKPNDLSNVIERNIKRKLNSHVN